MYQYARVAYASRINYSNTQHVNLSSILLRNKKSLQTLCRQGSLYEVMKNYSGHNGSQYMPAQNT